jgi:ribosome-associated toxin RatA of RatAB toxin-antitoxin module
LQAVERSAIVSFTPAQMFALVNDVARYPEFLPWCIGARIADLSETERLASVKIARGVLRAEFTTRNTLQRDAQILTQLVEGPLKHLHGLWRFDAIGERGSRVQFRVEFEFKNPLTAAAFSSMFQAVCATIVDAFVQRAKEIYPKNTANAE